MTRLLATCAALLAVGGAQASTPDLIAFSRGGDLYTIRADGGGLRLLLAHGYDPAWSPDGERIAFVSNRTGDEEIYVAEVDGGGVRRITGLPGRDLTPVWSPGGRTIAFTHENEIWLIGADGSRPRPLVRRAKIWHEHVSPTWHGSRIVYASNRAGAFNQELYRVPARRLTFTKGSDGVLGDDGQPAFSPDGRLVAFVSNRTQQAEIWVMNADGSGQRILVRRRGDDFAPAWSPDGRRLAFSSPDSGLVYVVGSNGRGLQVLTRGEQPAWRPL